MRGRAGARQGVRRRHLRPRRQPHQRPDGVISGAAVARRPGTRLPRRRRSGALHRHSRQRPRPEHRVPERARRHQGRHQDHLQATRGADTVTDDAFHGADAAQAAPRRVPRRARRRARRGSGRRCGLPHSPRHHRARHRPHSAPHSGVALTDGRLPHRRVAQPPVDCRADNADTRRDNAEDHSGRAGDTRRGGVGATHAHDRDAARDRHRGCGGEHRTRFPRVVDIAAGGREHRRGRSPGRCCERPRPRRRQAHLHPGRNRLAVVHAGLLHGTLEDQSRAGLRDQELLHGHDHRHRRHPDRHHHRDHHRHQRQRGAGGADGAGGRRGTERPGGVLDGARGRGRRPGGDRLRRAAPAVHPRFKAPPRPGATGSPPHTPACPQAPG